jgi:hypothetical protein
MLSSAVDGTSVTRVPRSQREPTDPSLEAPHQTMAKRSRGTTSRPGQRPPLQRHAARPSSRPTAAAVPAASPAPRPDTLTDAEEARAAELEAAILAEERAAETAAKRRSAPARAEEGATVRPASSLAVAAANEYGYVARDVRRIAIVGGGLILILIALWLIVHFTGFSVL